MLFSHLNGAPRRPPTEPRSEPRKKRALPRPDEPAAESVALPPDSVAELDSLIVPSIARPSSAKRSLFSMVREDVRKAGVRLLDLGVELVRGISSEALRWGANLCLFGLGLQAVVDGNPAAPAFVALWAVSLGISAALDHTWRRKMNEFDRAFARVLTTKLFHAQGRASLQEVETSAHQGAVELHLSRVPSISNLLESTVALPSYATRVALSAGVLCLADWRVALSILVALTPGIIIKHRQIREDLELDERQSPEAKVIDTIRDEAFVAHGSLRMIMGRFTARVSASVANLRASLDEEINEHERRQAWHRILGDAFYYSLLGTSMGLLYQQYEAGAIGIGVLGFLWLQLIDLGAELDDQTDTVQSYLDLYGKTRRFYEFTADPAEISRINRFPADHTLSLVSPRFVRGEGERVFAVSAPSIVIPPGGLLLIKGASGAGKTTLHRCLAFGVQPQEGQVMIGSALASSVDTQEWFNNIAYCGAASALQRGLTVRESLTLDPDGERYLGERLKHPLIRELIEDLATGDGLDTRIGMGLPRGREFSTGELQRLMLVSALVPERKLLFLDEVTSNQSEAFIEQIMGEIERLRAHGSTVVMVTHSQRFNASASHILKVSKGIAEEEEPSGRADEVHTPALRLPQPGS